MKKSLFLILMVMSTACAAKKTRVHAENDRTIVESIANNRMDAAKFAVNEANQYCDHQDKEPIYINAQMDEPGSEKWSGIKKTQSASDEYVLTLQFKCG